MDPEQLKQLEASRTDTAVSIAKGILGAVPYGGALFAEIIGVTVPNQRLDRVTKFLSELDKRLDALEREALRSDNHAIDLFEDALVQASRALTEKRNCYIAIFLKRAMRASGVSYATKKKLFQILEELTDADVDVLGTISDHGYQAAAHKQRVEYLTIGAYEQLDDEKQYAYNARHVSWQLHIGTLERMGLIDPEREGQDLDLTLRHIDERTGLPRTVGYVVSRLGRLLLKSIEE